MYATPPIWSVYFWYLSREENMSWCTIESDPGTRHSLSALSLSLRSLPLTPIYLFCRRVHRPHRGHRRQGRAGGGALHAGRAAVRRPIARVRVGLPLQVRVQPWGRRRAARVRQRGGRAVLRQAGDQQRLRHAGHPVHPAQLPGHRAGRDAERVQGLHGRLPVGPQGPGHLQQRQDPAGAQLVRARRALRRRSARTRRTTTSTTSWRTCR